MIVKVELSCAVIFKEIFEMYFNCFLKHNEMISVYLANEILEESKNTRR